MRRFVLLCTAVLSFAFVAAPAVADAAPAPRPLGHTYDQWLRIVGQFFLGDASNPLIAGLDGACGEQRGNFFLLAAPITQDEVQVFDCEIPTGTWIVLSHAAYFTTGGTGDTDVELEAGALAGFVTPINTLTLDGEPLKLRTAITGAYDVHSEPGGFYDVVIGAGTGDIRTAIVGNVTLIHPLPPGDHVIESEVLFSDGEHYSATYHIRVAA
jgi:hypothetical protein